MTLFALLLPLLTIHAAPPSAGGVTTGGITSGGVTVTTDFECGLNHPTQILGGTGTPEDPVHLRINFPPGRDESGFFLFRLDGVAGLTVRIDFHTDRAHNWRTLNPVWADLTPFLEEQGVNTDAILADPALYAAAPPLDLPDGLNLPRSLGNTELPVTRAPGSGKRQRAFQHWHYMPRTVAGHDPAPGTTEPDAGGEPSGGDSGGDSGGGPSQGEPPGRTRYDRTVFRLQQKFPEDAGSVAVAMKVPYTPQLLDNYIQQWQERHAEEASRSGRRRAESMDWDIVNVGESKEGRPLWLIRFGEAFDVAERELNVPYFPPPERSDRPTILFYAREHPDEHDTSWVTQGVAEFMLSNQPDARAIRRRANVLVIPLLDPNGAVINVYETDLIRAFEDDPERPREALAWATWMRNWIDSGNRLDVVFNLHNVESGEGPHVFVADHHPDRLEIGRAHHRAIAAALEGFNTRGTPSTARYSTRFGGWLCRIFGTHLMFYEVNSQDPDRHLSLYELKVIGVEMLRGTMRHLVSDDSAALRRSLEFHLARRDARLHRYGNMPRLISPGDVVFDFEQSLRGLEGVERYWKEQGQRPGWFNPLYKRIESGELPPEPHWRSWNKG